MTHKSDDYSVGYKKPPKSGQFKKGRSGNPRGRPKQAHLERHYKKVNQLFDQMMLEIWDFDENGKKNPMPYVVGLIKKTQLQAIKGDRFARHALMTWFLSNLETRHKEMDEIAVWLMNQGYWNSEDAARFMEQYK